MNVAEMTLNKTCEMCPEQYDVLDRQGNTIAYMRLRHGYFEVTCPDVNGAVVYAANTKGDGCFYDDDEKALHIGAAVLAIEKYYAPGRWISVEDRLPADNERVLVWRSRINEMDVFDGHFVRIRCETAEMRKIHSITHWMPLPEPPKEG